MFVDSKPRPIVSSLLTYSTTTESLNRNLFTWQAQALPLTSPQCIYCISLLHLPPIACLPPMIPRSTPYCISLSLSFSHSLPPPPQCDLDPFLKPQVHCVESYTHHTALSCAFAVYGFSTEVRMYVKFLYASKYITGKLYRKSPKESYCSRKCFNLNLPQSTHL